MPGMIEKVNLAQMTCEVQITIKAQITNPDASTEWVALPLLVDCPLVFPCGGGFTLTFPVTPGDEVLVVIANRCIDAWWQSGGVQVQADLRLHDLSDGFALPGPRSLPNVIPAISSSAVQLRNDVGTAFMEIQADASIRLKTPADLKLEVAGDLIGTIGGDLTLNVAGAINITSGGDTTVTAPTIKLVGNVQASGGGLTHNGTNVGSGHRHGGVATGINNTGTPI